MTTALLESADGGEYRKDLMINLHKIIEAELGFKLATTGSAVTLATNCALEPGHKWA